MIRNNSDKVSADCYLTLLKELNECLGISGSIFVANKNAGGDPDDEYKTEYDERGNKDKNE